MTTNPLSIDEFFTNLSTLFDSRRNSTHGSIYLTQKRRRDPSLLPCPSTKPLIPTTYQTNPKLVSPPTPPQPQPTSSPSPQPPSAVDDDAPFPDLHPSQPLPLLIRASNGKSKPHRREGEKIKISTVVQPDEVEKFFVRYAEVMKGGMSGLKKRDRSGRKRKEREKGKGGKKDGKASA